jgi:protein ImuB
MPRIACLWVPDLSLRAHLRLEPDLASVPLAVIEGRGSRSSVAATSRSAYDAGVVNGMRTVQARAVCDGLVVRQQSAEAIAAAVTALADVAGTVSPRVEVDAHARVFLDCQGTGTLWQSESALASALASRAERCGLPVWVGVADSKLAAAIAAHVGRGIHIVPPGRAQAFLAPHPVSLLDPDLGSAATLASWGIRSIGELAALPVGAAAHRLGPAGATLLRCARGEDVAPLVARAMPTTFADVLELDYGEERLEPLMFVLRRLIECVASRIDVCGLACRQIEIIFDLEGGGRDLRTIVTAAPTTDVKTLLTLVRAQLEADPPAHAVVKLEVAGAATPVSPTQLDLLRPAGPAPAALAAVVARLSALCGPDRVGVLRPADSHRPEAVEVGRFEGASSARSTADRHSPSSEVRPVVRLALRAFRPAAPLEVFENRGRLDYVRGQGFGGRVVHWGGPWRVRGEWWTTDPYAREYYDVELSDGGVYRIHRDVRTGDWLADGVYD